MKRIISMAILLVMALSMVLQPAYAADAATAEYVFRLAGEDHDRANADTTETYEDSFSGNWSWYGKSWASDAATTAIFRQSKKATYNANDRIYVQNIAVDEWFALDIKAPEASGIYSVDFDYSRLKVSAAGACDIYFVEKPNGEFNEQAVDAALVNSSSIGNIDCSGGSADIEKITKKLDNIVFKEGKSYLLVFKATKASNIPINGMKITKIGDVGKLEEVSIFTERKTIPVGDTASITVSGKDSNGVELKADNFDAISYASSNEAIATVSDGVITGVASGTAKITVTATLGEITKNSTIDVTVGNAEKYLFSGVSNDWGNNNDTVIGIGYGDTSTGNWAWHGKSAGAGENIKVFATEIDPRLQANVPEGEWFALKIKSPGTGKWVASLECVVIGGTAKKSNIYIIPLCDEDEVASRLVDKRLAGNVDFADTSLTNDNTTTKIRELNDFTLYENREYLVVFKVTGGSRHLRPNQLILTEIPGAEIEEPEWASDTVSFAVTTNIPGEDVIRIESLTRGQKVDMTQYLSNNPNYKFVGWMRGAYTEEAVQNESSWVTIGNIYNVWTNTFLTAIYEPITESDNKVVEFWNQNGAYLGKSTEATYTADIQWKPTLTGYSEFIDWFISETEKLPKTFAELKAGTTNAVAKYKASAVSGVTFDGGAIDGAGTYNKEITLSATSDATTCWKRDEVIIAYGDTYKFNVWDATNIMEGTEKIVDKVPVAILDYSEKHNAYMLEYDAGDYEIAEAGIIFGKDTVNEKRYTSQRKEKHNQFTVPKKGELDATGYIIYKLDDENAYVIKYFSVAE